ncbi:hypothetical protein LTR09_002725 [Extremus antarcticus]|uniref:Uncharacterized protein n=1 Tax=Extremus antarcticus TaxID=702011 RepID=A0AAJ0GEX0_9PEZI|nr:hypothetical protein LTR09_002725 [Extremus antarcticus]
MPVTTRSKGKKAPTAIAVAKRTTKVANKAASKTKKAAPKTKKAAPKVKKASKAQKAAPKSTPAARKPSITERQSYSDGGYEYIDLAARYLEYTQGQSPKWQRLFRKVNGRLLSAGHDPNETMNPVRLRLVQIFHDADPAGEEELWEAALEQAAIDEHHEQQGLYRPGAFVREYA